MAGTSCLCDLSSAPPRLCEQHQAITEQHGAMQKALMLHAQIAQTIDMLQMTALAACRVIDAEPDDAPRLLISGACRSLERLIEMYQQRGSRLTLEEQGKLKAMIQRTAADLQAALTEGIETASRIAASLDASKESVN